MNFKKIRVFVSVLAASFFIGFILGIIFMIFIPNNIVGAIPAGFIVLLAIFAILALIMAIIYSIKFFELYE